MIKDHPGDAATVATEMNAMQESFGLKATMEVGTSTITNHVEACPIYDGLLMSGIDHDTIGELCRASASCESAAVKRIVPDADASLKEFRSGPDGVCIEEIKLA
jgi:hypothetical protein